LELNQGTGKLCWSHPDKKRSYATLFESLGQSAGLKVEPGRFHVLGSHAEYSEGRGFKLFGYVDAPPSTFVYVL
jgi:hypothetical protein